MFHETITPHSLHALLRKFFPGADSEVQPFTGGTIIKTQIWEFLIELALTTKPIAIGEREGSVRMAMYWRHPEGKTIRIKQGTTTDLGPVKAFLLLCKGYLEGISAAIAMACDEREPEEANLF